MAQSAGVTVKSSKYMWLSALDHRSDTPRGWLGQDMLQVKFAVEIGRDLGPGDLNLEVVPLAGWGWRIANPFHRGSLAFLEFPQNQIIFQRICADGEVVALRLEVDAILHEEHTRKSGSLLPADRGGSDAPD